MKKARSKSQTSSKSQRSKPQENKLTKFSRAIRQYIKKNKKHREVASSS